MTIKQLFSIILALLCALGIASQSLAAKKHAIRAAVISKKNLGQQNIGSFANKMLNENYTDGLNGNILLVFDKDNLNWNISMDDKL